MNIKTDEYILYERLEAWLKDDLEPPEEAEMTLAIMDDPKLAALADRYLYALQALQVEKEADLQRKISVWKQNMEQLPQPPRKPGLRPGKWTSGMLGLGFLLVIGTFSGQSSIPPEKPAEPKEERMREKRDTTASVALVMQKSKLPQTRRNYAKTDKSAAFRRTLSIEPEVCAGMRFETLRFKKVDSLQIWNCMAENNFLQIQQVIKRDSCIEVIVSIPPADALPTTGTIPWPCSAWPEISSE